MIKLEKSRWRIEIWEVTLQQTSLVPERKDVSGVISTHTLSLQHVKSKCHVRSGVFAELKKHRYIVTIWNDLVSVCLLVWQNMLECMCHFFLWAPPVSLLILQPIDSFCCSISFFPLCDIIAFLQLFHQNVIEAISLTFYFYLACVFLCLFYNLIKHFYFYFVKKYCTFK